MNNHPTSSKINNMIYKYVYSELVFSIDSCCFVSYIFRSTTRGLRPMYDNVNKRSKLPRDLATQQQVRISLRTTRVYVNILDNKIFIGVPKLYSTYYIRRVHGTQHLEFTATTNRYLLAIPYTQQDSCVKYFHQIDHHKV